MGFGKKQLDNEELETFLRDIYAQQLALFDAFGSLNMVLAKQNQGIDQLTKAVKELVALGWNQHGVQKTEGGTGGRANGEAHQGEGQGSVRIPVVGRHGVEALSGASQGARD